MAAFVHVKLVRGGSLWSWDIRPGETISSLKGRYAGTAGTEGGLGVEFYPIRDVAAITQLHAATPDQRAIIEAGIIGEGMLAPLTPITPQMCLLAVPPPAKPGKFSVTSSSFRSSS
jgi:hypothetical protein